MKFLAVLLAVFIVGCHEMPSAKPAPISKDTGWVTVTHSGYLYHKTLLYADGLEREFYTCAPTGGLEEGSRVKVRYQGDGTSMDKCAEDVAIESQPGTKNSTGKIIHVGVLKAAGDQYAKETLYLNPDRTKCGTVRHSGANWEAYAYEEYSVSHYFPTQNEAVAWMETNWCTPKVEAGA